MTAISIYEITLFSRGQSVCVCTHYLMTCFLYQEAISSIMFSMCAIVCCVHTCCCRWSPCLPTSYMMKTILSCAPNNRKLYGFGVYMVILCFCVIHTIFRNRVSPYELQSHTNSSIACVNVYLFLYRIPGYTVEPLYYKPLN